MISVEEELWFGYKTLVCDKCGKSKDISDKLTEEEELEAIKEMYKEHPDCE